MPNVHGLITHLCLLKLCGPVKSWKHVPDPTTGALKGFGFCEFRNVEGVLRALRLLSKLSIGGQELMVWFPHSLSFFFVYIHVNHALSDLNIFFFNFEFTIEF